MRGYEGLDRRALLLIFGLNSLSGIWAANWEFSEPVSMKELYIQRISIAYFGYIGSFNAKACVWRMW